MPRISVWPAILALGTSLVTGSVAGCARQDAADRSVEKLKSDISKLQADRDHLDERIGALEAAEQQRDPAAPRARGADARSDAPRGLPVVHLGEGETPPPPDEGEPTDAVAA